MLYASYNALQVVIWTFNFIKLVSTKRIKGVQSYSPFNLSAGNISFQTPSSRFIEGTDDEAAMMKFIPTANNKISHFLRLGCEFTKQAPDTFKMLQDVSNIVRL